jgi:hypothetical protein
MYSDEIKRPAEQHSPGRPQGSPLHPAPPPPLQRPRGRASNHAVVFVRAGVERGGVGTLAVALVLLVAGVGCQST